MITFKQKLLAKLFNNPLGRRYLGVPKSKKIYKITKSSAHYYTGEIAKNGMPIICTGEASPNGRNPFIYWLETWKPIHLCWLFNLMGWKIPKYFIGADTGAKVATATGGKNNQWTNPTYAYVDDTNYATVYVGDDYHFRQSYETFGFEVPASATINGIEIIIKHKESTTSDFEISICWWCQSDSSDSGFRYFIWSLTDATATLGSSSDLWETTPIDTDFSNANFSFIIDAYGGSFGTAYLQYFTVKVYYTEAVIATGGGAFLFNML